MKKTLLSLIGMATILTASAQLSVGVNANYTMYKGQFQKSTPGVQARLGYAFSEKGTGVLSFTYGAPIKQESSVELRDNLGGSKSAPSEIRYKFKTINLVGHYTFAGDNESTGKFYGIAGAGLVLVSYDETVNENYDKTKYTAMDQVKGKDNGLTLNFGLGGEYRLGSPAIFAEAGLALPANQANGQYIENVIPAHFILNVGLKISIGGNSDY